MKNGLLVFASLVLGAILIMPQPAEAKRFGGGGSFGKQHSMPAHQRQQQQAQRQQSQQQQQQRQAQRQQAVANSGTSRWLGPLAGLAAGGLLAWMFFGDGFDGLQFMDILLFGALAFGLYMLLRALRARQSGQYAGAPGASAHNTSSQSRASAQSQYREAPPASPVNQAQQYDPNYSGSMIGSGLGINALHHVETPSWFNPDAFVEGAKQHFVAVQKAWDQGDASEIESYCTPELFAELQALMADMVPGENYTEVDTLHSELVDQSIDGDYFVVSIRFSGYIKESRDDDAHAFNEIWHIRRLQAGEGNWQIAGIQQQF